MDKFYPEKVALQNGIRGVRPSDKNFFMEV